MCPSIPAYCPLYKLIRYFIVLRTLCGTPWMKKKTTQVGIYGNSWATFKSKGSCARAEKLATITEPPSKTFIHQNLIIMYIYIYYIILYCFILYVLLYYFILYVLLYYFILYYIICFIILCYIIYFITLYHIILYYIICFLILYYIIWHYVILYFIKYNVKYLTCIILNYIILCYIIYYITLYHIILYYIILFYFIYIHHVYIYIPYIYIYILCIVQPTNMLLKRLWSFFLSSCSSPLRKLTYRYQFQLGTPKNGWSSHVNPCKSPQKRTKNHQTISKF